MIYLDYNATTPVLAEARAAVADALERCWGNPSSGHASGKAAKEVLERARETLAGLVGAEAEHVTFTSGATEGINQVIASIPKGSVLISAVEHPAVLAAIDRRDDLSVEQLPVGSDGRVQVADAIAMVERSDAEPPSLVCVMAANNETGIVQPVRDLTHALGKRRIPLMVDAVQYVGRLEVDFLPDWLITSAHKLGGPKGAGAIVSGSAGAFERLRPLIAGGGQERRKRGGTESIPAIAGFAAALRVVARTRDDEADRLSDLKKRLEEGLLDKLPGSKVIGRSDPRLPNTCCYVLPEGVEAEPVMTRLSGAGIMVSAGSACNSGSLKPSRVLTAMGLKPAECFRAMRLSLGASTTSDEIDAVLRALPKIARAVAE